MSTWCRPSSASRRSGAGRRPRRFDPPSVGPAAVDLVSNNLLLTNQLEKNTFAMDGDRQAVKDGHSRTSLLLNNVLSWCVMTHFEMYACIS